MTIAIFELLAILTLYVLGIGYLVYRTYRDPRGRASGWYLALAVALLPIPLFVWLGIPMIVLHILARRRWNREHPATPIDIAAWAEAAKR